jgi:hypothetical protein
MLEVEPLPSPISSSKRVRGLTAVTRWGRDPRVSRRRDGFPTQRVGAFHKEMPCLLGADQSHRDREHPPGFRVEDYSVRVWLTILTWILIAIALACVGVLVYLFWNIS